MNSLANPSLHCYVCLGTRHSAGQITFDSDPKLKADSSFASTSYSCPPTVALPSFHNFPTVSKDHIQPAKSASLSCIASLPYCSSCSPPALEVASKSPLPKGSSASYPSSPAVRQRSGVKKVSNSSGRPSSEADCVERLMMFNCDGQLNLGTIVNGHGEHINCGCVIDTSTQETTERDFHLWLNRSLETAEEHCQTHSVYDPSSCAMQPFRDPFHIPSDVEHEDVKPYMGIGEPIECAGMSYAGVFQPAIQNTQVEYDICGIEKIHISPAVNYDKTSCMVGGNIPGSSYPNEFVTKKLPKKRGTHLKCSKGTGTNLYGRPYCPGRPLDMEVRRRIIQLYKEQKMKVNAISKELKISHGCVSKIIKRYNLTGNVSPASSPEQRRPRRTKKSSLSIPQEAMLAASDRMKMSYDYPLQRSLSSYQ